MNHSKNKRWSACRYFPMALIFQALFLFSSGLLAQTVTATPRSVDTTDPPPVVLRVNKVDGSPDAGLISAVKSVKVDDAEATITKTETEAITIAPPKLSAGIKSVQLLDKDKKEIAAGQLQYQSVTSADNGAEARRDRLAKSNWYYVLVTLMFGAVLGPFILAIYRGTSGSHATTNRPLGLPVGSFRSILAYSLVAYVGFYVLTSILSVSDFSPPPFLLGIVATVIGFYFGSRSGDDGEASSATGTVRGTVRSGANPARGAIVKFKRSTDGSEPYSRISDLDGRFDLHGVTPGQYKVSASLGGSLSSDEQELSVGEGSDHEIEIVIKNSSSASQPTSQTGTVQGTVTKPDGAPAVQAEGRVVARRC